MCAEARLHTNCVCPRAPWCLGNSEDKMYTHLKPARWKLLENNGSLSGCPDQTRGRFHGGDAILINSGALM